VYALLLIFFPYFSLLEPKRLHIATTRTSKLPGERSVNATLEFGEAVRVLEEHIEILKQNLLFLMAERKPENMMLTQKIISIKRELDKAVQERMKLSQIYSRHNSSVTLPAAGPYYDRSTSYDIQQS
jgi:hypothetical protein